MGRWITQSISIILKYGVLENFVSFEIYQVFQKNDSIS